MLDILASNRDFNIDIFEELKMLAIDVEKLAAYQLGVHNQALDIAKNSLEA